MKYWVGLSTTMMLFASSFLLIQCIARTAALTFVNPWGTYSTRNNSNSRDSQLPHLHQQRTSFSFSGVTGRQSKSFHIPTLINSQSGSLDESTIEYDENSFEKQMKTKYSHIQFLSPLLQDGYPPAVEEYEKLIQQQKQKQNNADSNQDGNPIKSKPILLYLPGFDGTLLAPFLQFPSLGEEFDVRGMTVGMEDRSSFQELKELVIKYLVHECSCSVNNQSGESKEVYLMGESFGGILASEVALTLRQSLEQYPNVNLKGLILVNPATCYLRSELHRRGPAIANSNSPFPPLTFIQYVYSLTTQLVPLFLDEGRAIQQLIAILTSKGLPSVVNSPIREAYMGRVAFSLPNRLKFMPQETLKWRLEQWLETGCGVWEGKLGEIRSSRDGGSSSSHNRELLKVVRELKTIIIAGELDLTLPSVEEAESLASEVYGTGVSSDNIRVHVVPEAGHASTCGGSLHLIEVLRDFFPELSAWDASGSALEKSDDFLSKAAEELFGLVPRYDTAPIGLSPLLYWANGYYKKWEVHK